MTIPTMLAGKVALVTGGGRGIGRLEQSWERYVRQLIPLARPQTPEDIGRAAVYLATAPNVTGQALNVDGGIEMH